MHLLQLFADEVSFTSIFIVHSCVSWIF